MVAGHGPTHYCNDLRSRSRRIIIPAPLERHRPEKEDREEHAGDRVPGRVLALAGSSLGRFQQFDPFPGPGVEGPHIVHDRPERHLVEHAGLPAEHQEALVERVVDEVVAVAVQRSDAAAAEPAVYFNL